MEEQLNNNFLEYEKLLKTKDYSMLSDSERSIVNRFSTEEEYSKIRKVILLNSEIINEEKKTVEPDPEILKNLIRATKSNKASAGVFGVVRNIFEYRIPAYQFALLAAASILLFFFIFKKGETLNVQEPVHVYKTDTIEKYIVNELKPEIQNQAQINNTIKNEQATLNKETTTNNTSISNDNSSSMDNPELFGINADLKEKIENSRPKGRSMLDDSSLVKFLVKI
jgi:hypothetical protein